MEQIASKVFRESPGTVISAITGAEVAGKDMIKLRPSQWLNDEIINFYGVMINDRSAAAVARRKAGKSTQEDEELLDVHVFSSFFYEKVNGGGQQSVKRWTRKVDLFAKDMVIMPVNLGNSHWVCAAINIGQKRFEYYDSMGRINHGVLQVCDTDTCVDCDRLCCFQKLRSYLEAEHLDKKKTKLDLTGWTDYSNPKTPQQDNGWDCGVFTSQFMECLSRKDGHFDFAQTNMKYMRLKMVAEIQRKELMPEEWM